MAVEQTSTPIVSRSGPSLETDLERQASTSTSTRLANQQQPDHTSPPQEKGVIGPWATRIQVIINQDTARAFQRYMADKNDFRPGKIVGSLLQQYLIEERYLEKPVVVVKCKHETGIQLENGIYREVCLLCGVRL